MSNDLVKQSGGHVGLMLHGRRATQAVHRVYDAIGGDDAFADWARTNRDAFYTKMYAKTMTREVERNDNPDTLEQLLEKLDQRENERAIPAQATIVEPPAEFAPIRVGVDDDEE